MTVWVMLIVRLLGPGELEISRVGIYDNRIECEMVRPANAVCIPDRRG